MTARYTIESFYRAILLNSVTTLTTAPFDIKVSKMPSLSSGFLTLSPNTSNEEIVYYSGTDINNNLVTITKRGVSPYAVELTTNGTDYNVVALYKTHSPLDIVSADINNIHINNGVNLAGDNTFIGNNNFSGDNAFTGEFRGPTFANTTARDSEYTAPANGDECFIVGTGKQIYSGGSWQTLGVGTPTPNGSTTVAGVYEEATVAEQGTATATGGTGARLVPANANLVKTSSGAADENKIAVLDANGKYNSFVSAAGGVAISGSGTPTLSVSGTTSVAGTNTGDETTSSIKSKLGITTLSGSNTGDQTITLTGDVTGSGTGSFATTNTYIGAVVRNDTTVTATTSATAVAFTGEDLDTGTFHDNSVNNTRLTVPTTAKYRVSFNGVAYTSASATDINIYYTIRKGGSTTLLTRTSTIFPTGSGSKYENFMVEWVGALSNGEYVELLIQKDSTGNTIQLNPTAQSSTATIGTITKIGV